MDVTASVAAAAVSAALAVALLGRAARERRPHFLFWGASLALFAVGCVALAWGVVTSWTPAIFRAYYLAGGVLTVPVLGLGSVWLLAPRVARGLTVIVAAFSFFAVMVVLTAATKVPLPPDGVPEGRLLFEAPPRVFAVIGNAAGTALVIGVAVMSMVRRRYVIANLLITAGVLVAASGGVFVGLGETASKAVPLALAALLIYAGYRQSRMARIKMG